MPIFFGDTVNKAKPFFYKINAAEFMAEVFKIPRGKHKEWLSQFALDLVAANGTTEYSKKIIFEVQEYRERQAKHGAIGGRGKKKGSLSDPKGSLSDPKGSERVPQGISISSSTELHPTKERQTIKEGKLPLGQRVYVDGDGRQWDVGSGEELNPFDEGYQCEQ